MTTSSNAPSDMTGFSHRSSAQSQYQATLEGSGVYTETMEDRFRQLKTWIYDEDQGLVMGRPAMHWLYLIIGFGLGWGFLILGTAGFMSVFYYRIISWNHPSMANASSILQTPGIGFRPQQHIDTRVIRYIKGRKQGFLRKNNYVTYQHHLDHIEAFIRFYENELQQGDNFMDCRSITGRRPNNTMHKVCVFDTTEGLGLGNPCIKQQDYGYDDGQPCVLLKLNKIFNWQPEEYTKDEVPDVIKDRWSAYGPYSVYVHCEGDDPFTRDNMGPLSYHPNNGFPFKYFPFLNQQGYRAPLMFVRLEQPMTGVLLQITCKAYARNILPDRSSEVGQVSFQLMMD